MPRKLRNAERIAFDPSDPSPLMPGMAVIEHAGDGWVNLLPGLVGQREADAGDETPGVLGSLFGFHRLATMCTWMPPRSGRRAGWSTLGVLHPGGRHAVRQLSEAGVEVPGGWRVTQDHARRGLLLQVPPETRHVDVVSWAVRAGGTLCNEPQTGRWKAIVYLPRFPPFPLMGR